ncbi:MAG: DNA repair protein RadC [Candidatus Aenigmarchaeota archaeon]|nr:DNA repair protein RadC [Candidatus Aenigmarchaeota archaeon]
MKKHPESTVRIKDIPEQDRPRERLIRCGPEALSNQELIAAILGTGSGRVNALGVAQELLARYDLQDFSQVALPDLKGTFGVSDAKACKLLAAIELGKRLASHTGKRTSLASAEDIARMLMPRMKGLKKEVLKGLYLDSKLNLLKEETISMGGLNTVAIQAADVFRTAVSEAAAAIVLVHNHPSGDPTPSEKDIAVTKALKMAGDLLGIELLDHVIIGQERYISLKDSGLL